MERIELSRDYSCNGTELKPRRNADSRNTWVFDGREIRLKNGATSQNTWILMVES